MITSECNSKDINKPNPISNSDDECEVIDKDNIMRQGKKCFKYKSLKTKITCPKNIFDSENKIITLNEEIKKLNKNPNLNNEEKIQKLQKYIENEKK